MLSMLYGSKSQLLLRFKVVSGREKEGELDGIIVVRFDGLEGLRKDELKFL